MSLLHDRRGRAVERNKRAIEQKAAAVRRLTEGTAAPTAPEEGRG